MPAVPLPPLTDLVLSPRECDALDAIVGYELEHDGDVPETHILVRHEIDAEAELRAALECLERRGLCVRTQRYPPKFRATAAGLVAVPERRSAVTTLLNDLIAFFQRRLAEAGAGFEKFTWVELEAFFRERGHDHSVLATKRIISAFNLWSGGTSGIAPTGRAFFSANVPAHVTDFRRFTDWAGAYERQRAQTIFEHDAAAALEAREAHAAWASSAAVAPVPSGVPAPVAEVEEPVKDEDRLLVFYAWQSDLPNSTNRSFIEGALERAIKQLAKNDQLDVRVELTSDTKGEPGAPDIAAAIFEKIDACDVFVADITTIGRAGPGARPTPNPSVLVELGFAARALAEPGAPGSGWDRVVLVLNTAFGTVDDMPFDICRRRPIRYRRAEGDAPTARDDLTRSFVDALSLIHEKRGPRRRARRITNGQRALWSAELLDLLELAKTAQAGLRRWYPPFYVRGEIGMSLDRTFENTALDLTVTDEALRAAAREYLRATTDYSALWFKAIAATKDPLYGGDYAKAITWMQEHDGDAARDVVDAAYRTLVAAVNTLLA